MYKVEVAQTKPVTKEKTNKALRGMNFYFLVGEHLNLRAYDRALHIKLVLV